MNLSQALKQKSRLAGELVRLNQILTRENARRSDSVSKVDQKAIWEKICSVSDELGILKAKIAVANVPIYSDIERMSEFKSRIAFLNSLPKREGEELQYLGDNNKQSFTWSSFINQERCDTMIVGLQSQINDLQDKIDAFNATITI